MALRSGAIAVERDPRLTADRQALLGAIARIRTVRDEIRRLEDRRRALEQRMAGYEEAIRKIVQAADEARLGEEDREFLYARIMPEVLAAVANCIGREKEKK